MNKILNSSQPVREEMIKLTSR